MRYAFIAIQSNLPGVKGLLVVKQGYVLSYDNIFGCYRTILTQIRSSIIPINGKHKTLTENVGSVKICLDAFGER